MSKMVFSEALEKLSTKVLPDIIHLLISAQKLPTLFSVWWHYFIAMVCILILCKTHLEFLNLYPDWAWIRCN